MKSISLQLKVALFIVFLFGVYFLTYGSNAKVSFKLGDGMSVTNADSTMAFNLTMFNQNRMDVTKRFIKQDKPTLTAQVRAVRIKSIASFLRDKIQLVTQIGLAPKEIKSGVLMDAYIRYNATRFFSMQFGQAKLPGNREQLVSRQNQQFIERSPTNALFRLDRDFGFQFQFKFGKKMLIMPTFSVSTGEGVNYIQTNFQHLDYSARLEWLPLGKFQNYDYADFTRNKMPKLALGVVYDFNNRAIYQNGQLKGNNIADSLQQNIHTVMADMNFMWNGLNIYGDYIYRTTPKADTTNAYTKGHSFFVTTAYTFKKNYEIAFRYNHTFAGKSGNIDKTHDYTFAFTKYFFEHNLKIQTEYTFNNNLSTTIKKGIWRMQVQIII